jgi:septal ring-binding cell division protein DamX
MKKLGKKKLFIFLGVVVVLLVIVVINLRKSSGGKVKVQTDKVTRGSITASVSGSAKIQPEVQVKISAFKKETTSTREIFLYNWTRSSIELLWNKPNPTWTMPRQGMRKP